MEITRTVFESQRIPRFGTSNPERMQLAFWEWMIRGSEEGRLRGWSDERDPSVLGHTPSDARRFFGQEGDYSKGPIWNFGRTGATRTPHPDGRLICIAGEHEDHYDPDFFIYNDVVVLDLDGSVAIYGYPKDIFPPTDFHSATLLNDRVILIGRLGYMGERLPGVTPVMALDLNDYQIRGLPSQGELPGWIFRHEADLGPEGITIRGGEICEEIEGEIRIRRNFDDFLYDPASGDWKRLTDRRWRQFSICDREGKPFWRGRPFKGCCSMDDEPWKEESPPEVDDPFIYVLPEAVMPRRFEYETTFSEGFSLEDRITVDGIDVCIKIETFAIEVMIEGDMDEAKANALVADIREGVEADTGRPCIVKSYA